MFSSVHHLNLLFLCHLVFLLGLRHAPGSPAFDAMLSGARSISERFAIHLWSRTTCNSPRVCDVLIARPPYVTLPIFVTFLYTSCSLFGCLLPCTVYLTLRQCPVIGRHFDHVNLCDQPIHRPDNHCVRNSALMQPTEHNRSSLLFEFAPVFSSVPSFPLVVDFSRLEFDHLLGFPGEGPDIPTEWTISSANIGSLKSNVSWKHSLDSVQCVQETRIGCNNIRHSQKLVSETGKALHMCAPLKGTIRSDGFHTTMNGGTAILAPPELSSPFCSTEDYSGLYQNLFNTHRTNACWVQVTPSLKALVFSIYAKTAASANQQIFDYNDKVFADIFSIAAQFGDIPILLAGDFQSNPLHYPSISNAVNFQGWFDPLSQSDANGDTQRPFTYSKDGTFSGSGDFCSSIDGILMNHIAHTALRSIEVISTLGSQHRPIRAVFSWTSIRLHGFVHRKFAPLDTSCLGKPGTSKSHAVNCNANTLWNSTFGPQYEGAESQEAKWSVINDFCVNTLISSGATWGLGERTRGRSPTFTPKQFCPGQSKSNSALTLKGSWLQNVLGRLWELFTRLQRPVSSLMDEHILKRTAVKAWRTLAVLHAPHIWHSHGLPSLVEVQANISWVQFQLQAWDFSKRQSRIKAWKHRIQESATTNKKYIFHHLKNKVADEPSNLVLDEQQNIVCQPNEAIHLINSKWDDIFSANALHEDPLHILRAVWPYLRHDTAVCELPPLTADALAQTIAARNPDAAAGLDGWRTTDLQALPIKCLEVIAKFFQSVEDDCGGDLPTVLVCAKQAILNKAGPASPINKRLITILSPMLLAYTGTRFRQLQTWQAKVMHPSLFGGIQGRSMTSISNGLRLDIDSAQASNQHLIGIKLDQSKCFDRLIPAIAGAFMLALGIPKGLVNVFLLMYKGLHKHLSYRGWISKHSVTNANGVAQGCSFSLIAINVYMHVWATFIEHILMSHPECSLTMHIYGFTSTVLMTLFVHSKSLSNGERLSAKS